MIIHVVVIVIPINTKNIFVKKKFTGYKSFLIQAILPIQANSKSKLLKI